jgi:uncharacterized phiE125 gp8 family phage protein
MGLQLLSGPAEEPITLDEAKLFAHVDHGAEDDLIDSLIGAGRRRCEKVSWRALVTQTWLLTLNNWPRPMWGREYVPRRIIPLPKAPLVSVSGITYVDYGGVTQTLSPSLYKVDATSEPGTVSEAYGQFWPAARTEAASVQVTFVCGYGGADAVPDDIKQAIKSFVHYCYRHRTDRDEEYLDRLFAGFHYGSAV